MQATLAMGGGGGRDLGGEDRKDQGGGALGGKIERAAASSWLHCEPVWPSCKKSVVYKTECRHVPVQREISRTRTIYSTETHTSDFILNTF